MTLPKRVLTKASIERLKPPKAGQIEHFDRCYPGLALRISYGGSKSFVFFYRLGHRLRRMTLGTFPAMSLADAREAWRTAREDVSKGRDPGQSKGRGTGATNFEGVSQEWLKRDQEKNRSHPEVKRVVDKYLLPVWAHRDVNDIGRRDILDLVDAIADRGAPIMARRVQAYIHRFFTWCVGRGIVDANPATALPKNGGETKRERVLTDSELKTVWQKATELGWPFGNAIHLLILTGARRAEIGQLRWTELAGDVICLSGDRTKNGQPHRIPLSKLALNTVKELPCIAESEFVFTTTGKTPISGWSKAKESLKDGLHPWRLHDLRRTVATGLQRLGTPIPVTEGILGHGSGSRAGIVSVYQRHDYAREKRDALESWGRHVSNLVQ